MTNKVWFITGTAKGLGYLIARDALRAGDKVVATSRTVDGLGDRLGGIALSLANGFPAACRLRHPAAATHPLNP